MRRALLAASACCALAGFSGPALAGSPVHVLTVQLPGGGVAQIRYTGDVPPPVVFTPAPIAAPSLDAFGPGSPFALMARISAQMDAAATRLLRQAESLAAAPMPMPDGLTPAAFAHLPPGAAGFSFVSTMTGGGACTESTEITYSGSGAPHVVSQHSGNCGPAGGAAIPGATPAATPAPAPSRLPGTILASNTAPPPPAGLVHEAAWPH